MFNSLIALCACAALPATVLAAGKSSTVQQDFGAAVNSKLAARGANYRLVKAESLGAPGHLGTIILFSNRGNKQLDGHFVPGDPRRGGFTDITWINDLSEGDTSSGLTPPQTDAAIARAMATWQDVQCSNLLLTYFGSFDVDFGVTQFLAGFGGLPSALADITHAGWLPALFFDIVQPPNGGSATIAVTFTYSFIDLQTGEFTDIDGNGKADVAFSETYYNDAFPWGIDDPAAFDVETVALHETGHSLSQEHSGKAFVTLSNGKVHFAPRTVMNAGYTGLQQKLTGSDRAGHCSIWASWPR